ncbi:MAG: type II secretion system F family protein [Deltaproteobacteria bacterium]|nr:type II secretion system F family protein [Deltaproteobacteria bacterium]
MAISVKRKISPHSANKSGALADSFLNRLAGAYSIPSRRVKSSDLIFFTSQLALMLEIGTPLNIALRALKNQTENNYFNGVLESILRDIEEGRMLSDALRRHPKVFSIEYISLVKAGEAGGFLQKILNRINEMQEKRQAFKAQFLSALAYPAFLSAAGLAVVIFVIVAILPKFTVFFEGKESILPGTTRFLMALSDSMRGYWWVYILIAAGLVAGIGIFRASRFGRKLIDRFFVSGPIVSRLFNKIYTCELLRTLGHLLESQVPLLEALEVTQGTVKNVYFRNFIDQMKEHVRQGGRLSQPFATYPYIQETVKQMVATGEETGNLPKVMLRLAGFYDIEVDREIKSVSTMIEPIALIVLGGVVGLIVSSVILPMFRLAHAIQ